MNRTPVVVAAALLVAVGGGALAVQDRIATGTPTGQVVKETVGLTTGNQLEVMDVEPFGDSLDKVTLRQGDQVTDYYVTQDGKYLIQNMVPIADYRQRQEARNDFISCLDGSGATLYGVLGNSQQLAQQTRVTQAQIQLLGGINGLDAIFGGTGESQEVQQQVVQNGVVWELNGQLQPGLKTVADLEQVTGCTYDANATATN